MAKRSLCALVVAFATVASAAAEPVEVFRFAHERPVPAPLPREQLLMPRKREAPTGTPGYYDPATRSFTPLTAASPPVKKETFVGQLDVSIAISPRLGIEESDTVYCDIEVTFSVLDGRPPALFADLVIKKQVNFAVRDSIFKRSVPFNYITDEVRGSPLVGTDVECTIPIASDGTEHRASVSNGIRQPPSGSVEAKFIMRL